MLIHENAQWHPLESLFGLLVCPVPTSLKAELTLAIAAFARAPELVGKVHCFQFTHADHVPDLAIC